MVVFALISSSILIGILLVLVYTSIRNRVWWILPLQIALIVFNVMLFILYGLERSIW